MKHRQVKHYGYEFSYATNDIDPEAPLEDRIPDLCQTVVTQRALAAGHTDVEPDQLTVNRYLPGQGCVVTNSKILFTGYIQKLNTEYIQLLKNDRIQIPNSTELTI